MALWLACHAPPADTPIHTTSTPTTPAPVDSGTPTPTVPTGSTPTAATADTGIPAVPLLSDVLSCDVSELRMKVGVDLHRVWIPDAVCNDGTPGAIFVRAAPVPTDRWVLFFEGGSRCGDAQACEDRWCGVDDDATKMSSRWLPEVKTEGGILGVDNAFGDWNLALFHYCSSDMWTGTQRDMVMEGSEGPFRLHFDGANNVDRMMDWLRAGGSSDDGTQAMPALDDASEVVVSGLSGGAVGVITHLDAIAASLPEARVVGVVDAMVTPDPTLVGDAAVVAAYEVESIRLWEEERLPIYGARVDESCRIAEVEPYRCIEPSRVQRLHVSTPFFVVHDLYDGPLSSSYVAMGATKDEYAQGSAAEVAGMVAARPELGAHVSVCRKHTRIGASEWFTRQRVFDGAQSWSVEEALVAWLAGDRVTVMDTPAGTGSSCP